MMFPHRRLSDKTKKAMQDCIENIEELSKECVEKAKREISKTTGHRNVELVCSGNAAIFLVLNFLKEKKARVMLPDQGAWIGAKKIADFLRVETCELKTDLGLIIPEVLEKEIKKKKPHALFLTSFAGYIAEQSIKEISEICRTYEVLLIEDASGAIGDERLANGKYSDFIACSTGEPKILNLYSGGFLSTSLDISLNIPKIFKINPLVCVGIVEELKLAKQIITMLSKYSYMLKEEIGNVVHKEKRGICVGLEVKHAKKMAKLLREKGLKTDLGASLVTICPNYNRFLKEGIVIELKKLDVFKIKNGDIIRIGEIINETKGALG